MGSTLPALPKEIASDEGLLKRLEDELGATREGSSFFPTVRVREVTYRILTEDRVTNDQRVVLYKAASLIMMNLLLTREDLRSTWRSPATVRILAGVVSDLDSTQSVTLLLHLLVGLSPAEISGVMGGGLVQQSLDRTMALLTDRLTAGNSSLEKLNAGGIGPVGDVTRVLEKVRRKELRLADALAADYEELLAVARRKLWKPGRPGFDAPSDVLAEAILRLPADPENAPQNRKQLQAFVGEIIRCVVIDNTARVSKRQGRDFQHEEIDELSLPADESDEEDKRIRVQMLEAVTSALERIARQEKLAIIPATRTLQDKLFLALMDLQLADARGFHVLLLKVEGEKTNAQIASEVGISVAGVKRDYRGPSNNFKKRSASKGVIYAASGGSG